MWQNPRNAYCSNLSNSNENHSVKINFATDGSVSSNLNKQDKRKKNIRILSPYLDGDKVHLISRVTEKKLVHKKADFVSSFPLAVGIYKANSDEFKTTKKANKKNKKSVLTLPNEPVPLPQTCTVSDMNDSEYFKVSREERTPKVKKRRQLRSNRKFRSKNIEYYDRDAQYCSQLNIDLDCSSTDLIENFTGIENGSENKCNKTPIRKSNFKAHDVWTILRNINRFQFRPSPSPSEDSVISIKKKKIKNIRQNSCKDKRFIGSCRTEQFAYISRYDLDNNSYSQSSLDRITVIDKQDELEIFEESKKTIEKIKQLPKVLKNKRYKKNKVHSAKAITSNLNTSLEKDKNEEIKQNNKYSMGDHSTSLELYHNGEEEIKKDQNLNVFLPKDCSENLRQSVVLPLRRANIHDLKEGYKVQSASHVNKNNLEPKTCPNLVNERISELNNTQLCSVNKIDASSSNIKGEGKSIKLAKEMINTKGSQEQINGITKIILHKEHNVSTIPVYPKPRLLTTMPTLTAPKLTQADIKRRLANMKFPLVILGKDQLSSSIHVPNHDPVQFSGLDKHIWPFMINWFSNGNKYKLENKKVDFVKNKRKWLPERSNINNHSASGNNSALTSRKQMTNNIIPKENNNKPVSEQKTKPIRLKEKMMKFMSQRNSARGYNLIKSLNNDYGNRKYVKGVDASTETQINLFKLETDEIKKYSNKYPWAKGKWTSDFIENVIKKIKNGVYYDQELKDIFKYISGCKEESTQTELRISDHILPIDITSEVHIEMKQDQLKSIPGFDETISELEIETFSRHQIAVKHCVTNVLVTFDISDANNILQLKHSTSCMPLRVSENQTKIFKYKNSIVNAVLPAELCSILPKMMRNIINASTSHGFPKLTTDKVDSQLSTISELTHENTDFVKPDIPISMITSPLLKDGQFSKTFKVIGSQVKTLYGFIKEKQNCMNVTKLLPNITINYLFGREVNPVTFLISDAIGKSLPNSDLDTIQKEDNDLNQTCMMLQPYILRNKAIVPAYKRFTPEFIYEKLTNITFGLNSNPFRHLTIDFCNCSMNRNFVENDGLVKDKPTTPEEIDSIFDRQIPKTKDNCNAFHTKYSHDLANEVNNKKIEKRKSKTDFCVTNGRNRKSNFVRLYKKCKSMSHISGGSAYTLLNKIANIDDFFQALGSAKILSSVLDGSSERKILASLTEMKRWMSTITPRQALLVLLLCNKKDTPNLVRYRLVILQGIAVNRITRASELDMEIEVIERENMNKIPQYEGITYLPASVENHDTLLEELCWIAKTTASDYQKTFDESSERLLKSLLEKRKKLNPSYLRVMARYVGLGLLKSTK